MRTVQLAVDGRGKTIKGEKKEGPFAPTYMCTHMHCTHTQTHTHEHIQTKNDCTKKEGREKVDGKKEK